MATLKDLEKLRLKYAREDAKQDQEEEWVRKRQEEREEQEREEERIQNELFTPWQRLSTWGRFKYITSGLLVTGCFYIFPLYYFINKIIHEGLLIKLFFVPLAILFGGLLFFWIDKMRDFLKYINTIKGKRPQIKFLDFI